MIRIVLSIVCIKSNKYNNNNSANFIYTGVVQYIVINQAFNDKDDVVDGDDRDAYLYLEDEKHDFVLPKEAEHSLHGETYN